MKYFLIAFMVGLFLSTGAFAQQDPQISQYMFNQASINPAAAGSNEGNLTLFYRNQWVSQPGAPKTAGLIVDVNIPNTNVGIGLNAIKSSQGPLAFTRLQTNYSYKVQLKEEQTNLYLGLQAGLVQYSVNTSELRLHDDITLDQTFNGNNMQKMIPDFGFGVLLKHNEYFLGAAIPHLLQSKIKFVNDVIDTTGKVGSRNSFTKIFRHYYITAGSKYYINPRLSLAPSVLFKYIVNAPMSADINLVAYIKENFWVGAGYRIGYPGAIMGMAGASYKSFKFGYCYDLTNGAVAAYTGGTHELMVNYKFQLIKDAKVYKKPYFLK